MKTAVWADRGVLEIDGRRLEYACVGPPPDVAPTLVLLHEGLGCVALWRGFPEALAKVTGMGVFAYSRAGYGRSDPADLPRPLDYMTDEATRVLPEVLDQIGIRRCILIGHSDGATIAAIYAGGVSDARMRGVVLMAPHFFTEPSGLAEIEQARDAFETGDLRQRMAKHHDHPENAFSGWNDAWLDRGFRDWNVTDYLDHIRMPVLAVQGRDDGYGTLAQIEELDARCGAPVERLILDDCGHAPFLEQAEATTSAIAGFCDRLWRIEAAAPVRG